MLLRSSSTDAAEIIQMASILGHVSGALKITTNNNTWVHDYWRTYRNMEAHTCRGRKFSTVSDCMIIVDNCISTRMQNRRYRHPLVRYQGHWLRIIHTAMATILILKIGKVRDSQLDITQGLITETNMLIMYRLSQSYGTE